MRLWLWVCPRPLQQLPCVSEQKIDPNFEEMNCEWVLFFAWFHAKPRVDHQEFKALVFNCSLFSSEPWPTNPARWRFFRRWARPNRFGPSHRRIIRRWSFVLSCFDHHGRSWNIECWDYWTFTRGNLSNYSPPLTLWNFPMWKARVHLELWTSFSQRIPQHVYSFCHCQVTGVDSKITLKCAKSGKGKRPMNKNDRKQAGQNAERDLHKRFALLGLSLPLKAEPLEHENEGKAVVTTHWVRPSTWIKVLLQKAPFVLLGENNHKLQCESFWALYRQHEPTSEVFKHRSESELQRSIPILIFGDEGRGAKRGNFLVWTVESAIGLSYLSKQERACNCAAALATLPPNDVTHSTCEKRVCEQHFDHALLQTTNYKGHSYLTRHLLFGIPHWLYKENKNVVDKHLQLLRDDLIELFHQGIEFQGLVLLGVQSSKIPSWWFDTFLLGIFGV